VGVNRFTESIHVGASFGRSVMFLERRNRARSCIACVYGCRVHTQRCEPSQSESISPLTASQWREALALRQPARRVNKLNGSCAILLRQRINHNADCAGCARSKRRCAQPGNAQHRTPRRCASQGTGNPWGLEPTGTGFLGISCVPSLVLGFRTRRLPLLPLWEKGVGGMRGKGAHSHVRSSTNGLALSGNADTISTRRPNSSASAWHRRNPAP